MDVLLEYFNSEQNRMSSQSLNAEKLIAIGEYKHEDISDRAALAALMEVIMMIYNLEEAILRT